MKAKYLLRFDDLCPTMNWEIWGKIEKVLLNFEISPVLAVVPDNQDPELAVDVPKVDFWDHVRKWQGLGWTIGLHGYRHKYVTTESGIIGINNRSEFAGLPQHEQEQKITKGIEIFRRRGITPEVWIAPAHSFDGRTVAVLLEAGIRYISDGYSFFPYVDTNGMMWIPQQIWRYRKMPPGIWTICIHHNSWSSRDVEKLAIDLESSKGMFTSFNEVAAVYRNRYASALDASLTKIYPSLIQVKRLLGSWRK